MQEIMRL